jgi:hypothetical protein
MISNAILSHKGWEETYVTTFDVNYQNNIIKAQYVPHSLQLSTPPLMLLLLHYYCHQITWSLLAWGWRGKLARGETQCRQLQPFSLHFKNIVSFKQWSELVPKISNKVIHSKQRDIISTVIKCCDEDRQCTHTPNRVYVFGTGITLPDRADYSCVQC